MKNATTTPATKTTILTKGNLGFGYTDHGDGFATVASGEWGHKGSKPVRLPLATVESHAAELRRQGWR